MSQALEPAAVTILSEQFSKNFEGMAFDGQFLYLTFPAEKQIYQFSRDFIFINYFDVKRSYSALCYDSTENCFWASQSRSTQNIFKLDMDLNEINQIQIHPRCTENLCICGLSFNCEENTILAACENSIFELSKDGECLRVIQKSETNVFSGVLSIAPYFAVIHSSHEKQFLSICKKEQLIKSFCFLDCYKIIDLIFYSCFAAKNQKIVFFILAIDSCCRPCLLKCVIELCGSKLCKCNFLCRPKDSDCTCDIIESIAQAESALAHILNAEGEKLQKAVEIADNVCELLEINNSVSRTITKVTFLEQVLYAKLDAINNLCPDKCKNCKDKEKQHP